MIQSAEQRAADAFESVEGLVQAAQQGDRQAESLVLEVLFPDGVDGEEPAGGGSKFRLALIQKTMPADVAAMIERLIARASGDYWGEVAARLDRGERVSDDDLSAACMSAFKASEKDWTAAAWALETLYPERWGPRRDVHLSLEIEEEVSRG